MRSVFRNGKQEKTGPKNEASKELCREANIQVKEKSTKMIEALCNRVIRDGSPETMNCLLRMIEMLDLNEKAGTHERKKSILDLWESELEWSGEANETTAETAPGAREPEAAHTASEPATPAESPANESQAAANMQQQPAPQQQAQREDRNEAAPANKATPAHDRHTFGLPSAGEQAWSLQRSTLPPQG